MRDKADRRGGARCHSDQPRRWGALLCALLVLVVAAEPSAQARAPRLERPTLVMFHAGGYIIGSTASMKRAAKAARSRGFRVVNVDYTLADPRAAMRDAVAAARSADGPVYAYGESSGGGLAARLVQRRLARTAYVLSPLADLVEYAEMSFDDESLEYAWYGTEAEEKLVSPIYHDSTRPIVATYGREGDMPDFPDMIKRWGACDPQVAIRPVPGGHAGEGAYYRVMRPAIRWLSRMASGRGEVRRWEARHASPRGTGDGCVLAGRAPSAASSSRYVGRPR